MMTTMAANQNTCPVYDTLGELLDALAGGRTWRLAPMGKHSDSLSGSPFEYAYVDRGERYIVKHISRDLDWIMRVLTDGADGSRPWALVVWQDGLLAAMPPELDTVIVGMAYDATTGHLSQVMRDVAPTLVPADTPIELAQHRRFLDHMAALHARFWGFRDSHGLITPGNRYAFAHPDRTAEEAAAGHNDAIPRMFPGGWRAVEELAPEAARAALAVAADPSRLGAAMAEGPQTLVHGDWKLGNLGSHPDGRTVLLDWAWPGQATAPVDLAWYLAVNCDRLPESKEDSITAYRSALEAQGIDTAPWWAHQLELALLGAFVLLGWSKAGNPAELGWWTERSVKTARSLGY